MRPVTPSQTVGPFFGFALPFPDGERATPDGALRVEGQLLDGAGEPVSDGLIEVFAPDQFARCRTDSEGAFHVWVRKPAAEGDHAPHLDVIVFARGLLKHLVTRLYFPDEPDANTADPVLRAVEPARRHTLVAKAEPGALRFDIHLQGPEETVFFAV
jgi:protocatechuate 3,4-dioxygenase alpha subunit